MIDQDGMNISSTSHKQCRDAATVSATKWELLLSEWIDEFDQLDTMGRRQVLQDVSRAHGELLMWLLAPATRTA